MLAGGVGGREKALGWQTFVAREWTGVLLVQRNLDSRGEKNRATGIYAGRRGFETSQAFTCGVCTAEMPMILSARVSKSSLDFNDQECARRPR